MTGKSDLTYLRYCFLSCGLREEEFSKVRTRVWHDGCHPIEFESRCFGRAVEDFQSYIHTKLGMAQQTSTAVSTELGLCQNCHP